MTSDLLKAGAAGVVALARSLLLGALLQGTVAAQAVQLLETGLPTPVTGDGFSGDNFGIAAAIAGDVAVIGAFGDTHVAAGFTFGIAAGSAYVFERVGGDWRPLQKLQQQPAGMDGDNYGVSVAIAGDVIAVGAPRRNPDDRFQAGSVFIYGRSADAYLLLQILAPADPAPEQRFGTAVVLWQDYLAVGAAQAGAGRVDLYRRAAGGPYEFERSLLPPPGDGAGRFGEALAMADAELLIGAPQSGVGGAVYRSRLQPGGWSAAQPLALAAVAGEELGAAVALDAALALVGAPGAAAGNVRVLTLAAGTWSQSGVIGAPGGSAGERFGSALAIDSGRAAVAAVDALGSQGRVHLYDRVGAVLSEAGQVDIADDGPAKRFGASLALGAGGVLIGADLDRVGPNRGQGSARWFQPGAGGYVQTTQLDSGDGAMFDRYGTAVAVDDGIALVGAYLEDTDSGADAGAAHWFQRIAGDWQYGGQIRAPDGAIEDRFGIAVDVDGERMAVGAYWDVVGANVDQGSVYLFRRDGPGWMFEAKLTASDGNGFAYFGASVALAGDRALVGAPGATVIPGPDSAGAAFVYALRNGLWTLAATLRPPQPQANSGFGFSVAADAEHLLVGAFQEGFAGQGAAYVYRSLDQVLDGELRAAAAQPGEGLGIAVALRNGTALLGAPGYDLGQQFGLGTVRTFQRSVGGWFEAGQWLAIDGAGGDAFGRALAFDGQHAVVGAPQRGVDNPLEGHAYVTTMDMLFDDGFE